MKSIFYLLLTTAVVFFASANNGRSVAVSQENGLSLHRIFSKSYVAGTRPIGAKISPDGSSMIFRWDSSSQNKYKYWMMNTDGSAQRMLADTLPDEIEWAPNATTIACTRKGDIYLTD